MSDPRERFRELDEIQAPDLWHEIEGRALTASEARVSPSAWAVVAVLILAVAGGAATLVASGVVGPPDARGGSPTPSVAMTPASTAVPTPVATAAPTPDPISAWLPTGGLIVPRVGGQTATLLADGRVLVAGGTACGTDSGACPPLASAEVYDPATGTWAITGDMNVARAWHTATLLANGTVLVAGGSSTAATNPSLASAELYDPATGEWSLTGPMRQSRAEHTAALLIDGRVLVAGGDAPDHPAQPGNVSAHRQASAELYDPLTGTWTVTGSMAQTRVAHTATRLLDGRVLVAGGDADGRSAELYDPVAGAWTPTGSLPVPFGSHAAVLLPDGEVLLAGGDRGTGSGAIGWPHAALYNPATDSWTRTADMLIGRLLPSAAVLVDGRVLVVGGKADGAGPRSWFATAELYDPVTGTWVPTPDLAAPHAGIQAAIRLLDGRVLVVGGNVEDSASAEIYDPGDGG